MNIDRVPKTSTVTLENEISDTTPLLPKESHVPLSLRPSIGEEVTTDGKHVEKFTLFQFEIPEYLIYRNVFQPNHQWIRNV